jgi:hypothetical protein
MRDRPGDGHGGSQRHPRDRDRAVAGRVVERPVITGDQPGGLRCVRDHHRADGVQRRREGPVDVVVIGSGARQQDGRHPDKINTHRTIVHRMCIPERTGLPWLTSSRKAVIR